MKYLEWGLFLSGAVLLAVLVTETGWARLWEDISLIGWWFALILAQEVLAYITRTAAWLYAISPEKRQVPLPRLFASRVAGDGINYLTPTATIGGEFVRARLVMPQLGAEESTASVTIAKFAETAGQVLFIMAGLAIALPFLPGLGIYRWWMFSFIGIALLGVVWLGRLLKRGFFTFASETLSRWGIARRWLSRHAGETKNIDVLIREYILKRPSDLMLSILLFTVAYTLRMVEVWLVLSLLGLPTFWHLLLGVEALSVLCDAVLFLVPAKMGTQEGGKMAIFHVLTLDPGKGLAMGVIRRGRELFWALLGLLFYTVLRSRSLLQDTSSPH